VHLLNEVTQHTLSGIEVSDNAILERTDRDDISWGTADHALRLNTDGENRSCILIYSNDAWLVENNPASTYVDQGVSGTKINRHIAPDK
jgi:hypothetical protein